MTRPREFDEKVVIDDVLQTFWSGSYAGVTTQELCDSAGLSRSSLYNTFKSKSDLYLRSLERYRDITTEERSGFREMAGTGRSVLEQLLLEVVATQQETDDRRTCLVINAAVELGTSNEEVAELTRGNLADFQRLIADLVERGQNDGSIASTLTATALAAVIHATINGVQVAGRIASDDRAARATVRSLMNLL